MGILNLVSALVFEPRRAFTEIDARPRWGLPLLAVLLCAVGIALWYQSVVDLEWVTDRALRSSRFAANLTEAQIEAAVKRSSGNPGVGMVTTALGTCIFVLIIGLITALYMLLAGKITGVRRSFRHWFAFTWWVAVPGTLLAVLAAAFVLLAATTTQIDQGELKPLSLNALFLHKSFDQPGYTLFSTIDLIQLYGICLSAAGVRAWSGRSWLFSSIFAVLPYALFFGIWALISLR